VKEKVGANAAVTKTKKTPVVKEKVGSSDGSSDGSANVRVGKRLRSVNSMVGPPAPTNLY